MCACMAGRSQSVGSFKSIADPNGTTALRRSYPSLRYSSLRQRDTRGVMDWSWSYPPIEEEHFTHVFDLRSEKIFQFGKIIRFDRFTVLVVVETEVVMVVAKPWSLRVKLSS